MVKLLVLVVALAAGSAFSASAPGRIVGGELTTIDKYPSIVQVDYFGPNSGTWSQSCGANILNAYYVLSAAHCFAGRTYDPSLRRIRAGTSYRNTGGIISYVLREHNHPTYGKRGFDGDITVVRLINALVYSPVVQRGTIIYQDGVIPDYMPVVHAGWGRTTQGGLLSPQLRDVVIYVINRELCAERYLTLNPPGIVTENMICAGLLDIGGRDACQGDSGGPLYYGNIIVGIVSWGHGCANETFPGLSTAVAPYSDWIVATAV
ncbi:trypsin, alkaline C-like [Manduca sexta]|uniref:Peptidase S1 domain-containing protein n=1 Tax=Manduca sexta TaxID=7130 RepID=A0A921YWY4_MANSE|nr:trypsin, alkaline C-like [Manduca sexta]XP_037302789.1 trypsin, alkaline C-like [Manduca sexta]XP_037303329.1 trypsin, alkaline C-like [Manduca sexta]KAG6446132.1 hypothetical protein O3G_MSEX004302 [Manduca sexta]KAG6446133.1 hypothetical protein O3G_MSEX004302 [Manduca sexta]